VDANNWLGAIHQPLGETLPALEKHLQPPLAGLGDI
jgi:hypothetical protein